MNALARAPLLKLILLILAALGLEVPSRESRDSGNGLPRPELERGPRQRQVALTFDADGSNEALPALLQALAKEEVIATFFLTGKWACEYPASATQIVDRGHVIGNHTWGHKDLTRLSDSEIEQEILRSDDRFVSAFGCRYYPLFRAPFGEVNPRVLRVVHQLGLRSVRWSIDTLDSLEPRKTASFVANRVLTQTDEELCGAIVLMNVGYPETCEALPVIIRELRQRGFEFVAVPSWLPEPQSILTGLGPVNHWKGARSTPKTLMTRWQKVVFVPPPSAAPELQKSWDCGTGGPQSQGAYPTTLTQRNQP